VRVRAWHNLHFKQEADIPFTLILAEKLDARGKRRAPKLLWLIRVGDEMPPLSAAG
jgi:hypothetical protein